jgi:hypothetical protein
MKYKNGLPKKFNSLSQEEQVIILLEMALEYPLEYKLYPLGKLHTIDKELSNEIFEAQDKYYNGRNWEKVLNNLLTEYLEVKKKDITLAL